MVHAVRATGERNDVRRLSLLFLLLGVSLLMTLPTGLGMASARPGAPTFSRPLSPLSKIHDGQSINHLVGIALSYLTDNESVSSTATKVRQYQVLLNTTVALPQVDASLSTIPLNYWGNPYQMPNGPDNLPPLNDWVWWVDQDGGVNDTSNWSVDPTGTLLVRTVAWINESFTIYGVSNPTISVAVSPTHDAGTYAVGGGFVLAAPGYKNAIPTATGYASMA